MAILLELRHAPESGERQLSIADRTCSRFGMPFLVRTNYRLADIRAESITSATLHVRLTSIRWFLFTNLPKPDEEKYQQELARNRALLGSKQFTDKSFL